MLDINQILSKKKKVFTSTGENVHIDSIMIEENGMIQKHSYKPDCLHEMRSLSKVLIALAYGIVLDKKLISLDTFVYPTLSKLNVEIRKDNLDKIKQWKIRHLLTYTCGYEKQMFSEKYIKDLDKNKLLEYVLNCDLPNPVGEIYTYNNAETFLLSVFFQEMFKENIADFIAREIFSPLGITEYKWENFGKYCPGGTGLYISHESLFKIGQLILHKGKFNNKQIISHFFIEEMCKTQIQTPNATKLDRVLPKFGVGYIMHISRDGYVYKDGTNGQYLIVNFAKNQLITILSSESEMNYVIEILRDLI